MGIPGRGYRMGYPYSKLKQDKLDSNIFYRPNRKKNVFSMFQPGVNL